MASAQCHKPSEAHQTYHHQIQHKKTETHHEKNNHSTNEHSFTDKVKEMAHSARKMFNHNEYQAKPTSNSSTGTALYGEKKKVKPTDGHEKNCMPRMLDHMKKKKKKKKKKKTGKHSGSGSDSGSSSDSDNDKARKKD